MATTNGAPRRCLFALVLLVAVLGACPTPAQEGGLGKIDTDGLARRIDMMCRSGHGDPSCGEPADAAMAGADAEGEAGGE
jgi:hypothetical protein